jgi:hypothetical protein
MTAPYEKKGNNKNQEMTVLAFNKICYGVVKYPADDDHDVKQYAQ